MSTALLCQCVLPESQQPCSVVDGRRGAETIDTGNWESQPRILGPGPGGFILKAVDIEILGHCSHLTLLVSS